MAYNAFLITMICLLGLGCSTAARPLSTTEPRIEQNPVVNQSNAEPQSSSCGAAITGSILGRQTETKNIPARLCFDPQKPVDKKEDINPDDGVLPPNVYEEADFDYEKLPAEVRQVIELTAGDVYKGEKFHLLVTPSPESDTNMKRTVKLYRFVPVEPKSEVFATWDFKRQNGKLALESANFQASSRVSSQLEPNSADDESKTVRSTLSVEPAQNETGGITKRVEFVRGKNSVLLKDTVATGTTNVYLINASRGQRMVVNLKSMKKPGFPNSATDATFGIRNPQNNRLLENGENTFWSGQLPETGEYVIDISGGRGNTDYALKIQIK